MLDGHVGSAVKVPVAFSIQCSSCQKWVHKKCSGIKGSMSKVAKSFICRGCLNPVTSAVRTSMENLGLPCHGNCCMLMTWQ